jgi:hypothetical protein
MTMTITITMTMTVIGRYRPKPGRGREAEEARRWRRRISVRSSSPTLAFFRRGEAVHSRKASSAWSSDPGFARWFPIRAEVSSNPAFSTSPSRGGKLHRAADDGRAAATAVPSRDLDELLAIWMHLSRRLARNHDTRTLYAVDVKGGGRSSAIIRNVSANRFGGLAASAIWNAT